MSARREHGESLPGRVTLNGRVVDRRTFLGALALTAAGSAVPFARGAPGGAPSGAAATVVAAAAVVAEGSWHVDDMWGHWPRYAHPISYTLVRHVPIDLDTVAPADRQFMM
jgi:hypothetical protein